MKRAINIFVKIAATISTAAITLVAIRRFFIDLQDMLGIRILVIDNKRHVTDGSREHLSRNDFKSQHTRIMKELMQPLEVGGLPLGVITQKTWTTLKNYPAALPSKARVINPHLLVLGSLGVERTSYLASLVQQDIQNNDRAVVLLDSKGDLADTIIKWMASHPQGESFAKRTLLLEPGNPNCRLGFDPLQRVPEKSLQSIASSVVLTFKSIMNELPGSQSQWNAQTANILRNSALLLMANGKNLIDLPTLLQDNDFRDILLENVEKKKEDRLEYGALLQTWGQYKRLARTDQWITWAEPILNRLVAAMSDDRIREIIAKPSSDINLREIIAKQQILIVKFDSSMDPKFLGSLIINQLTEAASDFDYESERKATALYADQLEQFLSNTSFESIIVDHAKNQIGIIGAMQGIEKAPEDFRNQLLSEAGTLICFSLKQKEAAAVAPILFKAVGGRKFVGLDIAEEQEWSESDLLVHQERFHFYCFRTGRFGGILKMLTDVPNDVDDLKINKDLMGRISNNSRLTSGHN